MELRREKQDLFARQRTKSNCRLYAARGGERHCQVIPCLFLQGTNHEIDKQTMKSQEMIRGKKENENQKKNNEKHEMTQKQKTAEWEVMERERNNKKMK